MACSFDTFDTQPRSNEVLLQKSVLILKESRDFISHVLSSIDNDNKDGMLAYASSAAISCADLVEKILENTKFSEVSSEKLTGKDIVELHLALKDVIPRLESCAKSLLFLVDTLRVKEMSERISRSPISYQFSEITKTMIFNLFEGSDFEKVKRLGKGAFGEVSKVMLSDQEFAEKKICSEAASVFESQKLLKEAALLMQLDHSHIIQLAGIDAKANLIYITVGNRSSLFDNIYKKDIYIPATFLSIFIGIADGLDYVHKKNIIHNDLHLGNVLLHEVDGSLKPKIIDFDLSAQGGLSYICHGNRKIMPAEKLSKIDEDWRRFLGSFTQHTSFRNTEDQPNPILACLKKPLSQKIDVWSFGMDLFAMMSGGDSLFSLMKTKDKNFLRSAIKFHNEEYLALAHKKFRNRHRFHQIGFDDRSQLSSRLRSEVVQKCFRLDPDARPEISEIKDSLERIRAEIA